ncbi:hypothetical protein GQ53DRAFT_755219 [Thozetella sp. PMI_491]|nr:hypothetical protein GQ53DRAFT_755219 [Thozetella sp. PMI_491]
MPTPPHNQDNSSSSNNNNNTTDDSQLWDMDPYAQPFAMQFSMTQSAVGPMYDLSAQPFLPDSQMSSMHGGYVLTTQGYASPSFTAPCQSPGLPALSGSPQGGYDYVPQGMDPGAMPDQQMQGHQAYPPMQASFPPSPSRDQGGRKRTTTCPVCSDTKGSARDLDRHLWTHHRDYAVENQIPSEERPCPYPHCPYVGRKDNLSRHIKTRHRDHRS